MAQKHEPINKKGYGFEKNLQNQKQQNHWRTTALELGQV